jgi:hypothetical protein
MTNLKRNSLYILLAMLACCAVVAVLVGLYPEHAKAAEIPTFHDCEIDGKDANYAGYQSAGEFYKCREGRIRIEGKWGEEIQGGWRYPTEFGRIGAPTYIGDEPPEFQMPKFQKWCKTQYGYTLCGWNEEEEKKQEQERRHPTRIAPPLEAAVLQTDCKDPECHIPTAQELTGVCAPPNCAVVDIANFLPDTTVSFPASADNIVLRVERRNGDSLTVWRDGTVSGTLPHDQAADEFWKALAKSYPSMCERPRP